VSWKRTVFVEEGFAENYLQIDGRWADHVLFGLTRERYDAVAQAERPLRVMALPGQHSVNGIAMLVGKGAFHRIPRLGFAD
jgi:hypothetical protein